MPLITYIVDARPTAEQIIEVYENAGLPRPTGDKENIQKMFDNSNLIITAWEALFLLVYRVQ